MLNIDYGSVTMDIKDYVVETCIKHKFHGECLKFNPEIGVFFEPAKRKCFTINNPTMTNIVYVEAKIKVLLFPNMTRPEKWRFVIRFPFPKQIFQSAGVTYGEWRDRRNL